jgi:hypothetical protein
MGQTINKFIIKLLLFLPILLFVIFLNYVIDPSQIFTWGNYEKGIARLLLEGKNVAGVGDYDDRLLQKYYVEALEERKDIVVLGSSRAMYIRSSLFPSQSFFNNSVSQATLNDYIAIYGMYRERRMLPKIIIISLDDWIVGENGSTDNWRTLQREYNLTLNFFQSAQEKECILDKYAYELKKCSQLLSPQYFHASFFCAVKGSSYKYYSTDEPFFEATAVKLSDGSFNYNKQVRQRTLQQVNAIGKYAVTSRRKGENIYRLSPKIKEKFEAYIKLILSDGVEIVFFMPPYHPKYFEQFSRASDKLDKIERYVQNFAAQKRIKVLGSYDPMNATCTEEDFFDEGHLKDSGIRKIFLQNKSAENAKGTNQSKSGFQ